MKFLCTKVRDMWLEVPKNIEMVSSHGLEIKSSFIGIGVRDSEPTSEEIEKLNSAIEQLFGENKKAFPLRLIDL